MNREARHQRPRQHVQSTPAEALDDAEVALRVERGELVRPVGAAPVDLEAVARLRDDVDRRRLGKQYYHARPEPVVDLVADEDIVDDDRGPVDVEEIDDKGRRPDHLDYGGDS